MTYSTFISNLENGDVENITLKPVRGVYEVRGQLKGYEENQYFITYLSGDDALNLINTAASKNQTEVKWSPADDTNGWVQFFTSLIPFIIIFILFFFVLNQAQGGGSRVMNFGKSKAKLYNDDKKK